MKMLVKRAGYVFDSDNSIWISPLFKGIAYSDGDESELRIANIIEQATDITVLSPELRSHCTDWPSLYHLSGTRANILRPLDKFIKGDILEIGSGCGAITRYLGECGANVLALEGSPRRAAIARARTRDLDNVTVLAEDFNQFQCTQKFDVITLIGVLEYSNLYISGGSPHLAMLQRVYSLLKPDGILIVAIENQLGLKYFAGAPEDHIGRPMYGIEGRYTKDQPQTFGKKVLSDKLEQAGFVVSEFLAPFPDYKLPVSILKEEGINNKKFDAAAFAWQSVRRDPQLPRNCNFILELAWPQVFKNGLAMEMANSFLIVASLCKQELVDPNTLAYHYSTERLPQFCKETLFKKDYSDEITVYYQRLTSQERDLDITPTGEISFNLPNPAPYINGTILSRELIEIITHSNWLMTDVERFSRRYLDAILYFAHQHAVSVDSLCQNLSLPSSFIDLLPQNIIVKPNGDFEQFDLEWSSTNPISIEFMLFRGLFVTLGSISACSPPADKALSSWKSLIQQTAEACCLPISDEQYAQYVLRELSIRHMNSGFSCGNLDLLLSYKLPILHNMATLEASVIERNTLISELNNKIEETSAWVKSLHASVIERDAYIAELSSKIEETSAWGKSLHASVIERDAYITNLNQKVEAVSTWAKSMQTALAERDATISTLTERSK